MTKEEKKELESALDKITSHIEKKLKVTELKKNIENIGLESKKANIYNKESIKEIKKEVSELRKKIEGLESKKIEIHNVEKRKIKVLENTHKEFKKILNIVNANLPVWLVGEAGSGKTTLAAQVAEALDIPFYSISVSLQTTKTDLFGYMDANGEYKESLFYKAYTGGGVFLLDEADAGNPNVLVLLNQASAGDVAPFPNGMKKKHKDFRLIAAANTFGDGADRKYIGRQVLDAATKDRFVFYSLGTDLDFVSEILKSNGYNKEIVAKALKAVKEIRTKVNDYGIEIITGARTLIHIVKLIQDAGIEFEEALNLTIYKGNGNLKNKLAY